LSPSAFTPVLLAWYRENRRDLPWRRTRDPYRVWLSEVILQQTRIGQGTPYYEKFVAAYPDVYRLAGATEEEVLKLWQGLGYYSRARNMHETAGKIVTMYHGVFPAGWDELRKLKGVGDYTAAAIASICFGEPQPVVDGNVLRFFARYFGVGEPIDQARVRKKIHALALERIDRKNPGDFNQAMMEFGAMVCTPANPGCANCPFSDRCIANKSDLADKIPATHASRVTPHRYIHYAVITVRHQGNDHIYLNKRTGNDIWKNLYDFPSVEMTTDQIGNPLTEEAFGGLMKSAKVELREVSGLYTHVLTHRKLQVRFYRFHSDSFIDLPYLFVPIKDIDKYPVPRLIEVFLTTKGTMDNTKAHEEQAVNF